jgi:predicted 3-demethylubiquinone-9 3-methyltransferase (glyoxalase superfamily)
MATKRKAARKAPTPRTASRRAAGTAAVQAISPCLWFDNQAEEAARFYVSVFKKGKIVTINRYPAVGQEIHHREPGSVLTVEFVLNGLPFTALNGGPIF